MGKELPEKLIEARNMLNNAENIPSWSIKERKFNIGITIMSLALRM
jgi:hypothetical protein